MTYLPLETTFGNFHPLVRSFAEASLGIATRSSFIQQLAEARTVPALRDQVLDTVLIEEQWEQVNAMWNMSYLETIARRNGASWITFNELPGRRRNNARSPERLFRVSQDFLTRMASITPAAFGSTYSLLDEHQRRFIKKPTPGNLRTLVYAAMSSLEVAHRRKIIGVSAAKIMLALGAISVLPPIFDAFVASLDAAWIVFATAALATTPWSEVYRLLKLLSPSKTTSLIMYRAN